MEKHALNKILQDNKSKGLSDDDLPTVKLIGTFKDGMSLYFLTELLSSKNEVWESSRSFGLISEMLIRHTFYQIC